MATEPTPITRADHAALTHLAGAQLLGVVHHHLPPADGVHYACGGKVVDFGLAAIDLDLGDRGTTTIAWAMAGEFEGLGALQEESYSGVAPL